MSGKGTYVKIAKKGHVIRDIKFATNYLLCVCGWEGKAFDIAEYNVHKKTADKTDLVFISPYKEPSKYTVSRKKVKVEV